MNEDFNYLKTTDTLRLILENKCKKEYINIEIPIQDFSKQNKNNRSYNDTIFNGGYPLLILTKPPKFLQKIIESDEEFGNKIKSIYPNFIMHELETNDNNILDNNSTTDIQ